VNIDLNSFQNYGVEFPKSWSDKRNNVGNEHRATVEMEDNHRYPNKMSMELKVIG